MQDRLLRTFLLPKVNRAYLLRLLALVVGSVILFSQVLLPLRIQGHSMEPTYRDGTWNFCWRGRYLFHDPKPGDVVVIRFAGTRVNLLKRIVALSGETVAFQKGVLLVNGRAVNEPYLQDPLPWNLAPRTVEPGKVYVVGDNRRVPMEVHQFGQVNMQRIVGGLLW
ncbi:signal peptidase I [Desulfobulbus rhabdoformis]|uniref:signal peptidase I n=1 Tax=Desulfobulbus rhabdoformis TaxID=34032 RepID=UPI003084543D